METAQKIKIWLKGQWPLLAVIFLSVVFFFGTSGYNYLTQADGFAKWSSPDETANYIFSKLYVQTGEMTMFEKYNLISDGVIHPRSFSGAPTRSRVLRKEQGILPRRRRTRQ